MWKPLDFPAVPAWPEDAIIKEYVGGCHCKRFRYKFTHPVFDGGEFEVVSCNCSICMMIGALNVYTTYTRFQFISGSMEELSTYVFNTKHAEHKFCPTCGVALFVKAKGLDGVAVHVRTVDGVDVGALKLKYFDGAKLSVF